MPSKPDRFRQFALALAVVGGMGAGEAGWWAAVRNGAGRSPPGWVRSEIRVPYRLSELSGDLPLVAETWTLDYHQSLRPEQVPQGARALPVQARVTVPSSGHVELWTCRPGEDVSDPGIAVILDRVGTPRTSVVAQSDNRLEDLTCTGTLPAPGPLPVLVSIRPADHGVTVRVGETEVDCRGTLGHHEPMIRAGLRRVALSDIEWDGAAVANPHPGPRVAWWLLGAALATAVVWAELWTGARAALVTWTTVPLLLGWLLARWDARLWAETARLPWLPVAGIPLILSAVPSALAKASHLLGRLLRERKDGAPEGETEEHRRDWPIAGAAAAAVPAIASFTLRPGGLTAAVALVVGLAGCLLLAVVGPTLLRRLGSHMPVRAATWIIGTGTITALAMGAAGPMHRIAVLLAGGAGMSWGLLVWANANAPRVRAYNLVSLLSVVAMMASVEGGVRYTRAGLAWTRLGSRTVEDDVYGWVGNATDDFRLFENAQATTYPDRGYPTRVPPPDGRFRVVAMGGSTTAGAWQNDDVAQFYPARLGELLGDRASVVNQGVGGWTTFQMHRYLADHLDELAPDLLTLYIGHNDVLTVVPVPYSQLWEAWQRGAVSAEVGSALSNLRLYQGSRYLLAALRPPGSRMAVPIPEARGFLLDIIARVEGRGGQVLLASEGLAPDPGPLAAYFAMMEQLAANDPKVHYVDTAGLLHEARGPDVFIDDCHLTRTGHGLVAETFREVIEKSGMLPSVTTPEPKSP